MIPTCVTSGKRLLEPAPTFQYGFTQLPIEIIHRSLFNLPVQDIAKCNQLCRNFSISQPNSYNDCFWKWLCERDFNISPEQKYFETYRDEYRYRSNLKKGIYVRTSSQIEYATVQIITVPIFTIADGKLFYYQCKNKKKPQFSIDTIDVNTKKSLGCFARLTKPIVKVIAADEKLLSLCDDDKTIFIHDLKTNKYLGSITLKDENNYISCFTAFDNKVYFVSDLGKFFIFDVNAGAILKESIIDTDGKPIHHMVARNNEVIFSAGDKINIWNFEKNDVSVVNGFDNDLYCFYEFISDHNMVYILAYLPFAPSTSYLFMLDDGRNTVSKVPNFSSKQSNAGLNYSLIAANGNGKYFYGLPSWNMNLKGRGFLANIDIATDDFKAKDIEVIQSLANDLEKSSYNINTFSKVIDVFLKMPKSVTLAICKELCSVTQQNKTPEQLNDQIEKFEKKQPDPWTADSTNLGIPPFRFQAKCTPQQFCQAMKSYVKKEKALNDEDTSST